MALTKTGSRGARFRPRVFLPHAALQVCVLLFTCVGLALGLLLPVADGRTPHKCVGYLTLALALFPLTAALWRPRPGSGAARRLWEGCHRGCGLAAVAAAFADGALGVRRTGMRPRCVPAAIMVRDVGWSRAVERHFFFSEERKEERKKGEKTHFCPPLFSYPLLKKKKKKNEQGAGLAVLTCTYGFKLLEATVLQRARGEKEGGGGGGGGEGKRAGGGHGGGDVEKARPLTPLSSSSSSSKGRASSKEEEEKEKELDDSARAVGSVSTLSPRELGEPGLGGCRGGGRRKGENKGGGKKEEEEEKEKSDSFYSAAGCFDREQ